MIMLTELQKRKLPNLFALHDLNKDGELEQSDFTQYTRKIASTRGWAPGTPQYKELLSKFMVFWEGLRRMADTRHDQRITLDTWFAYWEQILGTEGMYDQILQPLADLVFKLLDSNGDGAVKADEYALLYSSGGLDPKLAAAAFSRLDLDHDGELSIDELLKSLGQFFRSNDPEAPGNWLLGPF
jgi:Ca2+-binding EF-hand superfamily protein